ncbi:hypothetical protein WA026_023151 [Henosepilachna vigintioctopunctata]|uniref:Uncharacterized protein n=1 Tax=Henosepilachna vigintioctopunctata TaxID=420089 RepID=A0AAW1TZ09_9CUCU
MEFSRASKFKSSLFGKLNRISLCTEFIFVSVKGEEISEAFFSSVMQFGVPLQVCTLIQRSVFSARPPGSPGNGLENFHSLICIREATAPPVLTYFGTLTSGNTIRAYHFLGIPSINLE